MMLVNMSCGVFGIPPADEIAGVNYARLNGADVINASWGGGTENLTLKNEVEQARNAGIVFVAAVGNRGEDIDTHPIYPASWNFDNIITVAATDRNDDISSISSYGVISVDLAVPGGDVNDGIWTADNAGDSSYNNVNAWGTSLSAPLVTGTIALLKSQFPFDTHTDLIYRVKVSVDPLSGPGNTNKTVTDGRLNLNNALYIWSNATLLNNPDDGWRWLDWLEFFNDNFYPTINHNEHGWWYSVSDSIADLFFYEGILGWLWTSEEINPDVYRFSDGVWLFYDKGSVNPRWFYNYSTQVWESHPSNT